MRNKHSVSPSPQYLDKRVSILIVNLARAFGGAEVRVIETLRHLAADHHCGIAVLADSPLHVKLQQSSIKAPIFALQFRRGDPRHATALARIIRRHDFRIVDTHNPQSNLWGMAGAELAGKTSLVITAHSSRDMTASRLKTFLYDTILRTNNWLGGHFIAVSDSVAKYLTELSIADSRIFLVKNGIKVAAAERNSQFAPIRSELGWSEQNYVIILVGRLEPVKGHHYFINALPEILQRHPHIRCLVVGSGRSEIELKKLTCELNLSDVVHFTGFRDDIAQLLQASDAFCMPSLTEGLPYALLEACAHGIPVLCTKVGGMAKMLENGYSAILVPPMDVNSLVNGVDMLLNNPNATAQMAKNAYRLIRDNYSMDKTIADTLSVYRAVDRFSVAL